MGFGRGEKCPGRAGGVVDEAGRLPAVETDVRSRGVSLQPELRPIERAGRFAVLTS